MSDLPDQPAPTAALAPRDRFVPFLPARLFRAEQPALYLALAWLVTAVPALLLSALVGSLAPQEALPQFPVRGPLLFVLIVIVSPVLETALMGAMLVVLRRFLSPLAAAVVCALAWAAFHSLQAPAWGLVIWWPFLLFSSVFLVWRGRGGFLAGWGMATTLHMLNNLPPAIPIAFG